MLFRSRDNFLLPCQHSLTHYESLIRLFGAPNGVSTFITESKHIVTVKKPWHRLSRNNALRQILKTNLRLSQLTTARADFEAHGTVYPNSSLISSRDTLLHTSGTQPWKGRNLLHPDSTRTTEQGIAPIVLVI